MSRRKSSHYYGREGIILWISLSSDKYVFSGMLTSGNTMRLLASLKPLPLSHRQGMYMCLGHDINKRVLY